MQGTHMMCCALLSTGLGWSNSESELQIGTDSFQLLPIHAISGKTNSHRQKSNEILVANEILPSVVEED